jgi:predicted metalloprotease with PDZ domain
LSAGDVLVAIDGLRVTAANYDALLERYRIGDKVTVHAFRRDELMAFEVKLIAEEAPQMGLVPTDKPAAMARMRKTWLR